MAETQTMPKVTSREEWLKARKDLLAKEKEYTRAGDALAKERRNLPMVEVTKEYKFTSSDPNKKNLTLRDLFGDKRQLIVYHFMFSPEQEDPCIGCSIMADNIGYVEHLNSRDTAFYCVSRAPVEKLEAFKKRMGWTFPWVSSGGSDFNYDYHVTHDRSKQHEYNFEVQEAKPNDTEHGDAPGTSVFFRDGDKIYHTYSSYARGGEACITTYKYLDLTPLGRQEGGTNGIGHFTYHDKY